MSKLSISIKISSIISYNIKRQNLYKNWTSYKRKQSEKFKSAKMKCQI